MTINKSLSAVLGALVLTFLFSLPSSAVVDRAICSTADAGATCTGTEIIANTNEELTANGNALPLVLGSVAGTNTITATTTPAITSYVDGQLYHLKPAVTNTGAVTLNISSVAAKAVVSNSGTALGNAELQSGTIYLLRWYASNDHFRVMNMPMITASMKDELGCAGSQTVRRNAGDTAFECVTISGTGTVTQVSSGAGLTGGPITASGTLSFDYSDAGADPALAADACRFTSNATVAGMIVCEGDTADAFETRVVITDPTADRAFTIPNAASAAIQPLTCSAGDFASAVSALGVITCTTPAGGSGDSIRVETGDNTAAFVAATDPDFDDSGDIDFTLDTAPTPDTIIGNVRANSVALTTDTTGNYAAGDAEAGAALTGDSATAFFSVGTVDDARIDGSAEADEVNPTLGTQTQGNYQTGNTAGAGIAVTQTPAEGFSSTVAFDYADQGASPALAADACQFTSNATTPGMIVCEGDTADTFETRVIITDPTADRSFTIPNVDSAAVQPLTCGAGDFVSAVSALGALTCTTPAGGSGDSIRVEDGDNGGTFTAAADADFDDAGDINFVNGGGSPASITGEIRSGAVGTTEAAALDTGDITTGAFADARVDGSLEADEVNPTLGTQTQGNYALGDAEGGAATTGDSATAFFTLGALEVARGGNGAAPGADDQVMVSSSVSAGAFTAIPDSDGATQKLQYDVATNAFSAGTDDDVPEAGDFGGLSATAPITQSGGTISTSIATGTLVGRTTAAAGVMEAITPNSTLSLIGLALGVVDVTCTGCLGATEIAALDAGDITTGAFADARVDGSLEADEVNPTLGTQTVGNYVSTLTAGAGLAVTHTPGEGSSGDYALSYADQGASPALAADACQFTSNATTPGMIVCEGDTADAFETRVVITDPTVDRAFTIPNADSVAVQSLTCSGSDKVSAISALGVVTCTADAGAAGGDSVTVNSVAATDVDLDDTTPAAVSGANVKWQKDAGTPNNVSGYIPASSDTVIGSVELATTGEAEIGTATTLAVTPAGVLAAVTGKKPLWIPGGSLIPRTTNGCAITDLALTNTMVRACYYDATTEEGAGFWIRMPDTWNEGTISFVPVWTHPATTTNFGVAFSIGCLATSNADTLDAALGTAVTSVDTGGTTSVNYTGPESAAITCSGTPQAGDSVYILVKRVVADAGDTMAVDAYLLGVTVYYTDNAFVEP